MMCLMTLQVRMSNTKVLLPESTLVHRRRSSSIDLVMRIGNAVVTESIESQISMPEKVGSHPVRGNSLLKARYCAQTPECVECVRWMRKQRDKDRNKCTSTFQGLRLHHPVVPPSPRLPQPPTLTLIQDKSGRRMSLHGTDIVGRKLDLPLTHNLQQRVICIQIMPA